MFLPAEPSLQPLLQVFNDVANAGPEPTLQGPQLWSFYFAIGPLSSNS